jgi:Outer membrane protein beta-barrel domain
MKNEPKINKNSMRKILIVGLIGFLATNMAAQEGGKWRFGLKTTPSLNWYKPDGKIIAGNGVVPKIGGGLILEYKLANIISVQTGLQIDLAGGSVKYNNGTNLSAPNSNSVSYYYNNVNEEIVEYDPTLSGASHTHFQLNERRYSTTYVTLPVSFKMKTKEIGSFTYYGQFGINNSFRWKATVEDQLQSITGMTTLGTSETKSKIDVTKDMSFYTASLNMGLGTEMNLSGSTSLTFGLNYSLGFMNSVKKDSKYLERKAIDGAGAAVYSDMPQVLKSNAVVLLIGVLF